MQIEEVARIFGVPRPLLMVDDTSWGSGIEAAGPASSSATACNPQFSRSGSRRVERSLSDRVSEKDTLAVKFNPGAPAARGSMADQAGFFSKALGAPAAMQPWMTPNEVRDLLDMPAHADGDSLTNPMTAQGRRPRQGGESPMTRPHAGSHLRVV